METSITNNSSLTPPILEYAVTSKDILFRHRIYAIFCRYNSTDSALNWLMMIVRIIQINDGYHKAKKNETNQKWKSIKQGKDKKRKILERSRLTGNMWSYKQCLF